MPIFDESELSAAERAAKAVDASKRRVNMAFNAFVQSYKREFDAFWRSEGNTPQEMAAAWGTQCMALFAKSAATRDFLLALDPACLDESYTATPLPVTPNSDGTVTLG